MVYLFYFDHILLKMILYYSVSEFKTALDLEKNKNKFLYPRS